MALVTKSVERRAIPHEENQWMEFRTLSISDVDGMAGDGFAAGINMLIKSVVGWSYPEPCTPENIAMLDITTATWAIGVVQEVNHIGEEQGETSAVVSNLSTLGTAAGRAS